jgi:hypothetical protein
MQSIKRFARLAGIGALAALVLIGAPVVATSASAGAATAEATNGAAQLYWIDSVPGTIGRANIDGTGAVQNFIQGGAQPYGLATDATTGGDQVAGRPPRKRCCC